MTDKEMELELERKALADYAALYLTIVETKTINGYRGQESVELHLETPAKFRILETPHSDILHWNDDYLDPMYNAELVEAHPELANVRSFWINGASRKIGEDKIVSPAAYRVVTDFVPSPKKTFQVSISRAATKYKTFTVVTHDRKLAENMALELASDHDFSKESESDAQYGVADVAEVK